MDQLWFDLRLALRSLRRRPMFPAIVIVTIAGAVGLATAVLGIVHAVLLKPLPIRDQEQVVVLHKELRSSSDVIIPAAVGDLELYERETRAFEAVAGAQYDGPIQTTVRDGDRVVGVALSAVSGRLFDVLRTRPVLGRSLRIDDDQVGAEPAVVVSHAFWLRAFGGDPGIVGRIVRGAASGRAFTIVGVMPAGLEFPLGTDMWAPTLTLIPQAASDRGVAPYNLVGRLRANVDPEAARAEFDAFVARQPLVPGEVRDVRAVVRSIETLVVGDVQPVLLTLSAAVLILLLITVVNLANLFFVRGIERLPELAVRFALGGGRYRIARQLATEGAPLAVLGFAGGIVIAAFLLRALLILAPVGLPRLEEVGMNWVVLVIAAGLTTITILAVSVWPAIAVTSQGSMLGAPIDDGRRVTSGRRTTLGTDAIIVAEVALGLILLVGTGLIVRSLVRLQSLNLGYATEGLTIAELAMPASMYDDRVRQEAFYHRLTDRLETSRDVASATFVFVPPFSGRQGWDAFYTVEGQGEADAAANRSVDFQIVLPSYFRALGVPVVRGRPLTDADREDSPPVLVINETLARLAWPNQDAVGRRLKFGSLSSAAPWHTVVGVTGDVRYRDLRTTPPAIMTAWAQQSDRPVLSVVVVRTETGRPLALEGLNRLIRAEEPGVLVRAASTLDRRLGLELAMPRLTAVVISVFAFTAVSLVALGIFATVAAVVRQRTREIGIRLALGAQVSHVRHIVFGRTLLLTFTGVVLGLSISTLLTRLLRALLFGVSPNDPQTFVGSAILLIVIALIGGLVPIRRATRVDPLIALKSG